MRPIFFVFSAFFFILSFSAVSAEEIACPNGAQPIPGVTTSWVGNSWGGLRDGRHHYVLQDIADICVMPDGTVFTNVTWEEGGANCSQFRDGDLVNIARHTHGWGRGGGKVVAANEKYVYIACVGENEGGVLKNADTWPPQGLHWYGISRRMRSDISKAAPFEDGKGRPGCGDTLDYDFLVVNEVPRDDRTINGQISGIYADAERLFVSNPHTNKIDVFDAETMKKRGSWDLAEHGFSSPGKMVADPDGNLWIYHRDKRGAAAAYRISQFSRDGKLLNGRVSLDQPIHGFCFDTKNNLYFFDPAWGILVLDEAARADFSWASIPDRVGIIGRKIATGLTSTGGKGFPRGADELRFGVHAGAVPGLGTDADGNLYIAHNLASYGGGVILESYRIPEDTKKIPETPFGEKERNWRVFGLCFIDNATLDPDDETMIYTKEEVFKADWTKAPGEEAVFQGLTHCEDQATDFRFKINNAAGAWVRNVNGHKLLYVNIMSGSLLQIYKLSDDWKYFSYNYETDLVGVFAASYRDFTNSSGVKIPDVPNENTALIYRGAKGVSYPADHQPIPSEQGMWVDADGNIWRLSETQGFRLFPVKLDAEGVPFYDFENVRQFPRPAELTHVKRIRYDAATDTLYLGGCTEEHKNQHWKPMGPVICRYDNFLKGENPGTTAGKLRWKVVMPYMVGSSGHESYEPMGFDIAGDYMFIPYTGDTKKPLTNRGHVEVIRLSDASSVGYMEPDQKTVGEVGLMDMWECLSAHRLSTGEYIIFVEDDYKAKVLIYRLRLD